MKALTCTRFGPPSALTLTEVPDPIAGPGQVVVDMRAASLNFTDVLMIAGRYQSDTRPPFCPGLEGAGVVRACGAGVDDLTVGERVVVTPGLGAFAEQVVVDRADVIPLPDDVSFAQGAVTPIAYATTYHALCDQARLQPGQSLLVLGTGGGLGLSAVELGKHLGARVIAAASSAQKLDAATAAGADERIDYSATPLKEAVRALTGGRGVDVVYDPVGGDLTEAALRATATQGCFLVIGFASGTIPKIPLNLPLLKEASIIGVFYGAWAKRCPQAAQDNLRALLAMIAAGDIKPLIGGHFALTDYAAAFACITERRVIGKVVLTMP
jgi:NADPH2:quinone reductase